MGLHEVGGKVFAMPFKRYAEIGRVVYIKDGKYKGKLATIVDIIDTNRALICGPNYGIQRQEYPLCETQLLPWKLKIKRGQRAAIIRNAWEAGKITQKFEKTSMYMNILRRKMKMNMGDYDRFKLRKAKQVRNRTIATEGKKMKEEMEKALEPKNIERMMRSMKRREARIEKILAFKEKRKTNPNAKLFKPRRGAKRTARIKIEKKAEEYRKNHPTKLEKAFKGAKLVLEQERKERLVTPKGATDPAHTRTPAADKMVARYKKHLEDQKKNNSGFKIAKESGKAKAMKRYRILRAYRKKLNEERAKVKKKNEKNKKRAVRRQENRVKYGKDTDQKKSKPTKGGKSTKAKAAKTTKKAGKAAVKTADKTKVISKSKVSRGAMARRVIKAFVNAKRAAK